MKNFYKLGYLDCIKNIVADLNRHTDEEINREILLERLYDLAEVKDIEFEDFVNEENEIDIDKLDEEQQISLFRNCDVFVQTEDFYEAHK